MAEESKEIGIIGLDVNNESLVKEPIFLHLSSFRNSKYLDIRKYYKEGIDWKPTKKGITLTKAQLDELLKIIKDNEKEINAWLA